MLFGKPDLNKLARRRDVEGLIRALHHRDPEVRCGAALALGKVGDGRAIAPIVAYIERVGESLGESHDYWQKKMDTRWMLGSGVTSLAALEASDALPDVFRVLLASDISFYDLDDGLEQLVEVSTDDALYAALGLDGIPDFMRRGILTRLAERGDARALEPLLALLETGEGGDKGYAAKTLGELGDSSAIDPLARRLCGGGSSEERQASLKALRTGLGWTPRTPTEAAWTTIAEAEQKYSSIGTYFQEEWARGAADRLRVWGAEAADELMAALATGDVYVKGSLEVLGCLGDSSAIPVLRKFAETGDHYVSLSATWALIQIGGPDVVPILEALSVTHRKVGILDFSYNRTDDESVTATTTDNSWQREVASEGLARLRGETT